MHQMTDNNAQRFAGDLLQTQNVLQSEVEPPATFSCVSDLLLVPMDHNANIRDFN